MASLKPPDADGKVYMSVPNKREFTILIISNMGLQAGIRPEIFRGYSLHDPQVDW